MRIKSDRCGGRKIISSADYWLLIPGFLTNRTTCSKQTKNSLLQTVNNHGEFIQQLFSRVTCIRHFIQRWQRPLACAYLRRYTEQSAQILTRCKRKPKSKHISLSWNLLNLPNLKAIMRLCEIGKSTKKEMGWKSIKSTE